MKTFTKTNLTLFFLFIFSIPSFAQTKPKIKDDPINRERYEARRLVDPATGKIPENIRKKELKFARQLPANMQKATGWVHRGPYNIGGRTRALAVDINNDNIILAGGVSGGMWRSTDMGVSWTKVTDPNDLNSVSAIAQDTREGHTSTWYYGTGEVSGNSASADFASYKGNGFFKSTDNGASWTQLASTTTNTPQTFSSPFQYCWNMKVSPSNGYVYAAIYGMIYRSTDEGETWDRIFNSYISDSYSYATDVAVTSKGVLYIALSSDGDTTGFYKSVDNGDNWINITPASFPTTYDRTVIDIAQSNENTVYFLTYVSGENADGHNLWRYNAETETWKNLSANIPDEGGSTGSFNSQAGYDLLIKVKPDDENFVIIGGTDLWRNTNGFKDTISSTKIGGYTASNDSYNSYTNHHSDQHSLVFFPGNSEYVIAGHDGGLSFTKYISNTNEKDNGETVKWSFLNTGYLTTQAYAVAIDMETNNDSKILAGFQDNGSLMTTSPRDTSTWTSYNGGDGGFCAFGENGNSLYTSSQNGIIYRDWDYDSSKKWTRVDPDGAENQLFINPFVLDPINTALMYYAGGKVIWRNSNLTEIPSFSSDPATKNWEKMTNTTVAGNTVTALDVSYNVPNILYFGTDEGKIYKVADANAGDPAVTDITGDDFPGANIGCIRVNPYNSNEVLVSFTNYSVISIWQTPDGGSTWQPVSGNLEENPDGTGNGPSVKWIDLLQKTDGNKIYFTGTSTGLYTTTALNGANTVWTQESPNMIGNIVVDMIKVRKDGTVAAGTHGNGVYSAKYDSGTGIKKTLTDNVKAKIYPNPSMGEFTIEAINNTPATFRIIIYNNNGQPVYYYKENGIFSIHKNVNLQKHAKGLYYIEVSKNNYFYTYKILIK